MPLRFYNTLSRREEEFVPLEEGRVGMYVCGPTVYAPPHIGNMRTFFFADILHRYLEYRGYEVKFVMNLTDVDDKTIRGAREQGVSLKQYTEVYTEQFFESLELLGIARADTYPRATDHIDGMIELIQRLKDRGLAYEADGAVYYDISEFEDYGKLSRVDVSQGRRGERVMDDEYERDDVRDFALWKASKPEDSEVGAVWETPWGAGRPGWHIECSVMSMSELGETFDIHAGGIDLVFPHHEDEIAQSEGATGKPFARYWLHGEHLLIDAAKMSKSIGNIYTVQDLVERGIRPSSIRHVFLTANYRTKLNFTFEALEQSAESVRRIYKTFDRLRNHATTSRPDPSDDPVLHEAADRALTEFARAMDDDLNTSVALAALSGFVTDVNTRLDGLGTRPISDAEQSAARAAFERMDSVFQLLSLAERELVVDDELTEWVENLLRERKEARASRDFQRADEIREQLTARGVVVEDTPAGPRWSVTS